MYLVFKGGNEIVRMYIDRANKELKVASSRTHYKLTQIKYSMLFDKGKEQLHEKITDRLSDTEFKTVIVAQMNKAGYQLK